MVSGEPAGPSRGSTRRPVQSGERSASYTPGRGAAAAICSVHPGLAVAIISGVRAAMLLAFLAAELRRRRRLHQVVDAGAAAADLGFRRRHQLEAGNSLQQRPAAGRGPPGRAPGGRRRGTTTRAAIGWRGARGSPSSASTSDDVADLGAEGVGAVGPGRVVREQLAVFLHRRAAAGGVDDDRDRRRRARTPRCCARARLARLLDVAGMQRQGAAAPLVRGRRRRCSLRPRSTRTVASLTWAKASRCTQPVRTATFIRSAAGAPVAPGAGAAGERRRQRHRRRQLAAGARVTPSPAAPRRTASCGRGRAPPAGRRRRSGTSASRIRDGYGTSAISRRAKQPIARGHARRSARSGRAACSISGAYWTPDGQAVTHARQPRQASKCCTYDGVISTRAPRRRPSSGRSARAANPSLRPTAGRSDTSAGRSRSARTVDQRGDGCSGSRERMAEG